MNIITIGATFVDIKGYPYSHYDPKGRNHGYIEEIHGGVCRNIAENMAILGSHSTLVSVIDDSDLAHGVLQHLNKKQVNTDYIVYKDGGLGKWLAIFDESGDVVSSMSQRPDLTGLKPLLLDKGEELIKENNSIIIELDIEEEVLDCIFSFARLHKKDIYGAVSNMSIALERKEYLKDIKCFVCNDHEAGLLFEEELPEDTDKIIEIIKKNKISEMMVVTLGEKGAVYVSNEESGYIPSLKVKVVDTTGCGDAFFSGVVYGLTHHYSLKEASKLGTTLASQVIGKKENVCDETLNLLG